MVVIFTMAHSAVFMTSYLLTKVTDYLSYCSVKVSQSWGDNYARGNFIILESNKSDMLHCILVEKSLLNVFSDNLHHAQSNVKSYFCWFWLILRILVFALLFYSFKMFWTEPGAKGKELKLLNWSNNKYHCWANFVTFHSFIEHIINNPLYSVSWK